MAFGGAMSMVEALDLCLECKACKAECPASVDMAKIKSEILHAHHRTHGPDLRSWAFAHLRLLSRLGAATELLEALGYAAFSPSGTKCPISCRGRRRGR